MTNTSLFTKVLLKEVGVSLPINKQNKILSMCKDFEQSVRSEYNPLQDEIARLKQNIDELNKTIIKMAMAPKPPPPKKFTKEEVSVAMPPIQEVVVSYQQDDLLSEISEILKIDPICDK